MMVVVTVFLSILGEIEIHLVENLKEFHHSHIPFNFKGDENQFSECTPKYTRPVL